ncbi:hypothetical protein KFK14_11170 [Sphingobium phenoxybenzoativorans]|uniref:Uncharacterized protein n=1 Tax=Sphingobium phenoxybenzoativorans TaxID=1592790 RepID=A0A975KAM3_9SPHN|nr:hypothetical protein [Sphingobium phenoxybenzoativorans]QUT07889.1 hypothetical protein KFK14_11170 [Sphingobium phenoxybenzoativorans]
MLTDDLDTIAANSFRNFHAKGLDYLCLHRSPELTIKAYFYDVAGALTPEVVNPHDHRYPFSTHVLAGASEHLRYYISNHTPEANYECFHWRTPLLGGDGFQYLYPIWLAMSSHQRHRAGGKYASYWCDAEEIHTIRITQPDTILLLYQHEDVVGDNPTMTFVPVESGKEPPALAGLYDRMPLSVAESRLKQFRAALAKASTGGGE